MTTLVDLDVMERYDEAFSGGADKRYPTLNLVRLEISFFGREPGRLLDYGFGTGTNLIHLLERGHEVDGIDVSKAARDKVAAKLADRPDIASRARLTLLPPGSARLPFDDGIFDYVVCMSVLSLLTSAERVDAVLDEFARVAKPGAKVVLDINGPESEFAVYGKALGGDVYEYRGIKGDARPIRAYCPASADAFADRVGRRFAVDDVGFTAHRFLQYAEQEYIVCAHKE